MTRIWREHGRVLSTAEGGFVQFQLIGMNLIMGACMAEEQAIPCRDNYAPLVNCLEKNTRRLSPNCAKFVRLASRLHRFGWYGPIGELFQGFVSFAPVYAMLLMLISAIVAYMMEKKIPESLLHLWLLAVLGGAIATLAMASIYIILAYWLPNSDSSALVETAISWLMLWNVPTAIIIGAFLGCLFLSPKKVVPPEI
jgi:hypothetical protein